MSYAVTEKFRVLITTDRRLRRGSAIAYREEVPVWTGHISSLPRAADDCFFDHITVHPEDEFDVRRSL